MNWLRRVALLGTLAGLVAAVLLVAQPSPPRASANVLCDAATSPAGAVTEAAGAITGGAIGGGNPVGDACNSVTDGAVGAVTSPVTGALKGIGNSIFGQVTTWVSEGAVWLIGEVVKQNETTTTPQLTSEGFLAEYAKMTGVAALLASAMVLFAILEAMTQGSWAVLGKALFVNLPLAFVGASVAFTVIQLLLVTTDQMSHAVAVATHHHSETFFNSAIGGLSQAGGMAGGAAGDAVAPGEPATKAGLEATGSVAAPAFVVFLGAIVGAFAAFCLWIELLMRDASVYIVALFVPFSLAAAISPRWSNLLRRTVELLIVIIGSKFVIVAIIALASSLIAEKGADVEHILAASALLLLACFAPIMLMRMVLSTEAAVSAAFSRRSAAGQAVGAMQVAGGPPQMMKSMARSNWSGPEVWSVKSDRESGTGQPPTEPGGGNGSGRPPGLGPSGSSGGRGPGGPAGSAQGGGGAARGGSGSGAAGAAASVPVAAVRGAASAGGRLEGTATAGMASSEQSTDRGRRPASGGGGVGDASDGERPASSAADGDSTRRRPSEAPPRPPQDVGAKPDRRPKQ